MESKLASALTIGSVAITTSVAAFILVGPAVAAGLALVSLLAFVGWLRLTPRELGPGSQESLLGPYVLAIVSVLVLSTCRYLSGVVEVLASSSLFSPRFPVIDATWFCVFVVLPVSLMLLGGYYLSQRKPLGLYMAWWTAIFALADGLLQFRLELHAGYRQLLLVGAAVAVAQLAIGVVLCQRLLSLHHGPIGARTPDGLLTGRQRNLWSLMFASLVAVYASAVVSQAGLLPSFIICGAMFGGLVLWRKTASLHPVDPAKALPLYLLLLTFFYLHVGEEAVTNFNQGVASLSGTPWNDRDFTVLIGLVGPVVWVFSAWSLWKRQAFGNFIFCFMVVGMILGEPAHLLGFPVASMIMFGTGYEYFSGMYTALFPMIPALLAMVMIVGDHRRYVAARVAA